MKKIFPILLASMILLSSCAIDWNSKTAHESPIKNEKDLLLEKINLIADKNRAIDKEEEQKNKNFLSQLKESRNIIIDGDFPGSRLFFESNPLLNFSGSIQFQEDFIHLQLQQVPIIFPVKTNNEFWNGAFKKYKELQFDQILTMASAFGGGTYGDETSVFTNEDWKKMDFFQKSALLKMDESGSTNTESDMILYALNAISGAKENSKTLVDCKIPIVEKDKLIDYLDGNTGFSFSFSSDGPLNSNRCTHSPISGFDSSIFNARYPLLSDNNTKESDISISLLPDNLKTITVNTENLDEVNENTRFQVDNIPENYSTYLVLKQPLEGTMEDYDKVKFESLLESTHSCYRDGYIYTIYSDVLPGEKFIESLNDFDFQFPSIYRDSTGDSQYRSPTIGSVKGVYNMSIIVLRADVRKFINQENKFNCGSYFDPILLVKQHDFTLSIQ